MIVDRYCLSFDEKNVFQGNQVTMECILKSKDERFKLQKEYLRDGHSIISLSLVAPGPIKKNLILDYIFEEAVKKY